jgi:hypothetical protein
VGKTADLGWLHALAVRSFPRGPGLEIPIMLPACIWLPGSGLEWLEMGLAWVFWMGDSRLFLNCVLLGWRFTSSGEYA